MALYNDLAWRDIILMCSDLLQQGVLVQRDVDGKLDFKTSAPSWDVPWHFTVQKGNLNCLLWNRIIFNHIFKKVPEIKSIEDLVGRKYHLLHFNCNHLAKHGS